MSEDLTQQVIVKKLNKYELSSLKGQNEARRANCMELLRIKVKTCLFCGCSFETTGNRTCRDCVNKRSDDVTDYSIKGV